MVFFQVHYNGLPKGRLPGKCSYILQNLFCRSLLAASCCKILKLLTSNVRNDHMFSSISSTADSSTDIFNFECTVVLGLKGAIHKSFMLPWLIGTAWTLL